MLGIKPVGVPFNGTGPAMNALVGGQVDYMCDQIVNAVPQIKGGTIKAYAVATPERNPSLPDVPTTAEAGLPDFQAQAWNAIFAPKGTPAGDRRQAERGGGQGARRRERPQAPARSRQRHPGGRRTHARQRWRRWSRAKSPNGRRCSSRPRTNQSLKSSGGEGRNASSAPCRLCGRMLIFPGIIGACGRIGAVDRPVPAAKVRVSRSPKPTP